MTFKPFNLTKERKMITKFIYKYLRKKAGPSKTFEQRSLRSWSCNDGCLITMVSCRNLIFWNNDNANKSFACGMFQYKVLFFPDLYCTLWHIFRFPGFIYMIQMFHVGAQPGKISLFRYARFYVLYFLCLRYIAYGRSCFGFNIKGKLRRIWNEAFAFTTEDYLSKLMQLKLQFHHFNLQRFFFFFLLFVERVKGLNVYG